MTEVDNIDDQIGERGKNISEISRDSKTKIAIPQVGPGDRSVIIQGHIL